MSRIRCRYIDCVFLEDGFCGANSIKLDPDEGCLTYRRIGDIPEDEDWEEDELEEFWEEEDDSLYQDDDDEWVEESEN
jgi:hypothetical protein